MKYLSSSRNLSYDRSIASSKRVLHSVQSSYSSFNYHYPLLSSRSFGSCLHLLSRLPVSSILSSVFPSLICIGRCSLSHSLPNPAFLSNFTTNEDTAGGPLLRVPTIRRTTDTHCRHISLHFSHNERTPVQISLQYLHAAFGSEWDTL